MKLLLHLIAAVGLTLSLHAESNPLTLPIGATKSGSILDVSGEIVLREPDGPRGQYKHGFRMLNDSAAEWQKFYGVQFDVNLPNAREVELTASVLRYRRTATPETPINATLRVSGEG